MQEAHQILLADEGEETLVTPRFDEEESIVAQPVVPLDAAGRVGSLRLPSLRPRVLALVLASALAGVVLGGAGLYFYQSRSTAAFAAPELQSAPSDEVAQPSPALATEAANDPQPPPVATTVNEAVKRDSTVTDTPARETVSKKVEEREAAPAKGKASDDEGDDDRSAAQPEERPRRVVYDTQGPITEGSSKAERRARRVEAELQRAERVRERQRRRRENSGRSPGGTIEDIFEGRP